jgi:hypothetical protein
MDPNVMVNQILRLVRLDTTVFDEVRDRVSELVPALVVAAIASLLAGLGATLFWEFNFDVGPENPWLNMFILGGVFMAALYAVWVLVVYVMLAQVYKASADVQALFRTMGYAAWPLALSVLMFIPVLYPVFALGSIVLLFVMSIYAAQAVTNADSTQVVTANLAGLAVFTLVLSIIAFAGDATIIGAGIFAILYQIP